MTSIYYIENDRYYLLHARPAIAPRAYIQGILGTIHRHRLRNVSLGFALLLVGITAPLSLTKGNKVVGGNTTLVSLWAVIGALVLVWSLSTDWAVQRLVNARDAALPYLPRLSVSWKPPTRRFQRRRRLNEQTARKLVEAGRVGERLARLTGDEIETEIRPSEVSFKPRRRSDPGPSPVLPNDHEAFEMWLDKENIPEEKRAELRMQFSEDVQTVRAERAPDHLKHREEAQSLREHGDVLEKQLWVNRKKMVRSGTYSLFGPSLPKDYTAEVEEWNKRVLDLADRMLSVKEAGGLSVYPKFASLIGGGPSVEQLDALFKDNLAALTRIEAIRIEAKP